MRRRFIAGSVVAVLVAALVGASMSTAAGKTIKVNASGAARNVGAVLAGNINDKALGSGAILYTATGATTQKLKFRAFFNHGTVIGNGTITATSDPDGTLSTVGSGKFTGGTDSYTGKKGTWTETGTISKDGLVSFHVVGTLK